jgi:predicted enzyme related to lactoylglutathione lyase
MTRSNDAKRHSTTGPRRLGSACGWLLGCLVAVTLAAEPPKLLPLVDPQSGEHHVGKFVFVELVTPDLAAAKTFYGGLFGWTFRDVRVGSAQYAEASLDQRPVAGIVSRPMRAGEKRQPAWLSFVAVADVDAATNAAVRDGGRALSNPHDVPGRGRIAVLADPQGAVFGVLASSSGDPPEVLATSGEWIWASLFAKDPDTAAAFYQKLFDYEVFDLPDDGNAQHLILASGGYARAAANPLPSASAHAHWLNFVRVDSAARMAARVVALGGKVLLTPRDDRHGGQIAIVSDPQGAPFGLLEWPDDRSEQVSR